MHKTFPAGKKHIWQQNVNTLGLGETRTAYKNYHTILIE